MAVLIFPKRLDLKKVSADSEMLILGQPPRGLSANQIDLWLLPVPPSFSATFPGTEVAEILSIKEAERYEKFKVSSKKDEFLASRLLLRYLLEKYTDYRPKEIEAVANAMGKPFWYQGLERLPLFFNLSHTRGMICCALSRREETGCDVEQLRPRKYEQELARKLFSDSEQDYYNSLEFGKQRLFFYTSWTLKEAFVKAVGRGLRIPLTSMSFTHGVEAGRVHKVAGNDLGPEGGDHPWYFLLLQEMEDYLVSCATTVPNPEIRIHRGILKSRKIVRTDSSNL